MREIAGELVAMQYGRLADALAWSQRASQLGSRYSAAVAWNYVFLGDLDSARPWHEQYKRDFPNGAHGPWLSIEFFRASGAQQEAAKVSEELLGFSRDTYLIEYPLKVIRDYLIDTDRVEDAIDKYQQLFPELFLSKPNINYATISSAVDLILLLKLNGQNSAVDTIAAGCIELMQTMPRMAFGGVGLQDVELHAMLGNRDAAIEALAEAVAEGYTMYHDPLRPDRNFESIENDPEFKRLMGIIQDRVVTELAKVREMEQSGQLARTPEELDGIQFDLSL